MRLKKRHWVVSHDKATLKIPFPLSNYILKEIYIILWKGVLKGNKIPCRVTHLLLFDNTWKAVPYSLANHGLTLHTATSWPQWCRTTSDAFCGCYLCNTQSHLFCPSTPSSEYIHRMRLRASISNRHEAQHILWVLIVYSFSLLRSGSHVNCMCLLWAPFAVCSMIKKISL